MSFLGDTKYETLEKISSSYRLEPYYDDYSGKTTSTWVNVEMEEQRIKKDKRQELFSLLQRKRNNRTSRKRLQRSETIVNQFRRMSKEEILRQFETPGRDTILKERDFQNRRIMFEMLSRITGLNMLKYTPFCDDEGLILCVLHELVHYIHSHYILIYTHDEYFNLNDISERLKNDKDFLEKCYDIYSPIIFYFPNKELIKEYIDDINVLKKIVKYNSSYQYYIPDNYVMGTDKTSTIFTKICKCSDKWAEKINNEDFIYELLRGSIDLFFILSKEQKEVIKLEEFLKIYDETGGHYNIDYNKVIDFVKEEHFLNEDILISLIVIDKEFNKHIKPEMLNDLNFCMRLINKQNGFSHFLKPEFEHLRNNKEFILNLLKYRDSYFKRSLNRIDAGAIYINLSDELKKDEEIIRKVLIYNGQNLWKLSNDVFNWQAIQIAYAYNHHVQNAPCNGALYKCYNDIVCNKKENHLSNLRFFKNCLPVNLCYKRLTLSKLLKYNNDYECSEDIEILIANILTIFNEYIVQLMVDKESSRLIEYNIMNDWVTNESERAYNNSCIIRSILTENPHYLKE